ncbi:MAG: hypothetical protein S4CHLAM37_10480 [Chlamydiia bacterium]|nr:hypothetical protein [Chlamydiia bacterium]
MTHDVTIRISEEEDRAHLVKWLMDPVVLNWFPLDNLPEVEDAARIWLSYKGQGASFTACIDGKPAGMAVLYLHHFKKLKHQSLFAIIVHPDFRGKGVGTKLFNWMKEQAKSKFGVELFHLEVYDGNPAYNLYKRLGFEEYGRQEDFLKEKDGKYRSKINMQMVL